MQNAAYLPIPVPYAVTLRTQKLIRFRKTYSAKFLQSCAGLQIVERNGVLHQTCPFASPYSYTIL